MAKLTENDVKALARWAEENKQLQTEVAEQAQMLLNQANTIKKLQADVDFWQEAAKSATKNVIDASKLQAEVERLKSDESVPACVWAEDQEGNWDTKCGDKHYLTTGTPFENSMHWCCYCGGSLLEELYGEQAND